MTIRASLVLNRGDFENVEAEIRGDYVPRQINPRYRDPRYAGTTPAHFRNIVATVNGEIVGLSYSERNDAEAALFCMLPPDINQGDSNV
jgi:hypothetical protein